jgi:hypothetical protein
MCVRGLTGALAMKKHLGIEVPRRSDVVSRHKFRKARIVTQNIGILLPQKRKIGGLNHLNPSVSSS